MPSSNRLSSVHALTLAVVVALTASSPAFGGKISTRDDSRVAIPESLVSTSGDLTASWSMLGDPDLDGLISHAMRANTDLRQAAARLDIVRADHGAIAAASYPQGGVDVARRAGSADVSAWSSSIGLQWEMDLFGRQAHARAGARANVESAEAMLEAARLAIASEVSRTWFQLQGARQVLALREGAVAAQTSIVELTGDLVDLGRGMPGDLARSRAELASDKASLQQARDVQFALEARLAVLLGETPAQWRAPLARTMEPLEWYPLALPDPASLLRARPDVRAAERLLAASASDARAAGAARFPSLSLTGLLGFVSGDIAGLFSSGTDTHGEGATLSWGLFSLPRLNAHYRKAMAGSHLALAKYDQVVLEAIEETEVALQRHVSSSEQVRLRVEAARQSRIAADAARARYEEGAVGFLEALVAKRDALGAEQAAIESIVSQRVAVIDVLRALGSAPVATNGSDNEVMR